MKESGFQLPLDLLEPFQRRTIAPLEIRNPQNREPVSEPASNIILKNTARPRKIIRRPSRVPIFLGHGYLRLVK